MINNEYDYLFKILLVGDSGVGKSSIMKRFIKKEYENSYISTIGVDFEISTCTIKDKVVKLQIWDTAGQERFDSITTSYYRGAHGVLIVYDVSDKNSFENIKNKWMINVRKYCNLNTVIIAGNKCDLINLETYENSEINSFTETNNIQHIYTSAKDSINISEIFDELIKNMLDYNVSDRVENKKISSGLEIPLTQNQCCL